jgi:hypothetical protein
VGEVEDAEVLKRKRRREGRRERRGNRKKNMYNIKTTKYIYLMK